MRHESRKRPSGGGLTVLWVLFKVWGAMLSVPVLMGFFFLNVAHAAVVKESASRVLASATGFVWPVSGRISSDFGFRAAPDRSGNEFHTGIDIAAGQGTPVKAAAPGVVSFAGSAGGYGNLVKIRHETDEGYFETWYGHLSLISVAKGTVVEAGTEIGLVGSTGRSTGPHLHYEYRRVGDSQPTNPLQLYEDGRGGQ